MIIYFKVRNQNIRRIGANNIVADSKNYLYASFDFSSEWTGTKTAIFKHGSEVYHVLLEDDDTCLVPQEVIKAGGFTVSVFAGNLITTDAVKVFVKKSGYEDGGAPGRPTADIYNQIIEKLDSVGNSKDTIDVSVKNETLVFNGGKVTVTGEKLKL